MKKKKSYLPYVYVKHGKEKVRGRTRDMSAVFAEKPERLGANKARAPQQGRNQRNVTDDKAFSEKWKLLAVGNELDSGDAAYDDMMKVYRDGEVRHIPTLIASALMRRRLPDSSNEGLLDPAVMEVFNEQFGMIWKDMINGKMLDSDKKVTRIDEQKMDVIRYIIAYNNHKAEL